MEDLLATRQSEDLIGALVAFAVVVAGLLAGAAVISLFMGMGSLVSALFSPMFIYALAIGSAIVLAAGALFLLSLTLPPRDL